MMISWERRPHLIVRALSDPRVRVRAGDAWLRPMFDEDAALAVASNPLILFLGAFVDDEFAGGWLLERKTGCAAEVHTCLLPNAYGRAVELATAARAKVFADLPWVQVLTTTVPRNNPAARRLTLKSGFRHVGTLENYWLEDEPIAADLFQVTRKES